MQSFVLFFLTTLKVKKGHSQSTQPVVSQTQPTEATTADDMPTDDIFHELQAVIVEACEGKPPHEVYTFLHLNIKYGNQCQP